MLKHFESEAGEVVSHDEVRVHAMQLGQEIAQHGTLRGAHLYVETLENWGGKREGEKFSAPFIMKVIQSISTFLLTCSSNLKGKSLSAGRRIAVKKSCDRHVTPHPQRTQKVRFKGCLGGRLVDIHLRVDERAKAKNLQQKQRTKMNFAIPSQRFCYGDHITGKTT